MNNPVFLEYSNDVKEEVQDEHYPDNKIHVSETDITDAINISNCELNGNDKILDHIKTDLPSEVNDTVSNNVKIEDEVICPNNIRIKFHNEPLFCNYCHKVYQDYCTKCRVLVHILNERPCHNNRIRELPKYMLEARESVGHLGIFSLKVIPETVRFGPFTGLNLTGLHLKINRGKFVVNDDKWEHLHWMQYINPARNIYEQNLFPFQYDDKLYYCSTRRIQEGEELLVYFGKEYEDNLLKNVEMDFIPIAKKDVENVFACTFCCLGFSSKEYLAEHKAVSHCEMKQMVSVEELAQCPFCKIYLEAKEYFEHHMDYCYETNDRYCLVPTPEVHELVVERCASKRHNVKQWNRGIYKCTQCKFRTMYSAEFRHHTNQHYQVKMYKCGICHRRYKAKESLNAHVIKNHVKNEERGVQKYTIKHLKENCKCMECGYKASYKSNLEKHIRGKHLKQKDYKCMVCDFKTNYKGHLQKHIKGKHLKQNDYNCTECEFKTNYKASFKVHVKTQHLKKCNYKCAECQYKTNVKSYLEAHRKAKHLNQNDYKCIECEYMTNYKANLEGHIKRKHLQSNDYKCVECDFGTCYKSALERHIKAKHPKQEDCKCTDCEYMASRKSDLEKHIKRKHLKQNHYKCTECELRTCYKSSLEAHIKAKHLKQNDYECAECEFRTCYKKSLDAHIKAKHMKQNDYECAECEFKTNIRSYLKVHIKAKHLKDDVYKCMECEYETCRKSNLERHVKAKHLKQSVYQCMGCEFMTNYKASLKTHIKRKHPKYKSC